MKREVGPHTGAGLLVSVSDRSFFDTFKEASSLAKHVKGARDSDSQLVRELASEGGTGFGMVASPNEVQGGTLSRSGRRSRRCAQRPPTSSRATARSSSSSRSRSARPRAAGTTPRRPRSRRSRPRSRSPVGLRVSADAFRDAVDVVEVRDHLNPSWIVASSSPCARRAFASPAPTVAGARLSLRASSQRARYADRGPRRGSRAQRAGPVRCRRPRHGGRRRAPVVSRSTRSSPRRRSQGAPAPASTGGRART